VSYLQRALVSIGIIVTVVLLTIVPLGLATSTNGNQNFYLPLISRTGNTPTPNAPASPTAIVTATVTATITPPQGQFIVLSNSSTYTDRAGQLHVVGEVQNNMAQRIGSMQVLVDFYNSNNGLVGRFRDFVYEDSLLPGDKTCFNLKLPPPLGWATYQFRSPIYSGNGFDFPNLTILNDISSYNASSGSYTITGSVRNDQGSNVSSIYVLGTLYDGSNKVIGCNFAQVSSPNLAPNQTGTFELLFNDRRYPSGTTYRIQVDGVIQ
jgi:hypothetical protein